METVAGAECCIADGAGSQEICSRDYWLPIRFHGQFKVLVNLANALQMRWAQRLAGAGLPLSLSTCLSNAFSRGGPQLTRQARLMAFLVAAPLLWDSHPFKSTVSFKLQTAC